MKKPESSPYINNQRRQYSLYVMRQRAIPSVTDGLKAGGRRVLWTARDGKKYKSASLAGATMPIHPHASPEDAIDTLAAQYGNNIPLFKGDSAFGTLLEPKKYSASRYTTVSVSQFTKDVIYADIDVIPMIENYDGTLEEPLHFLPLVPVVLLNPAEGVAIGYATNILPRGLDDIIIGQITHLKGSKKLSNPNPKFYPIDSNCIATEVMATGRIAYYFEGEYEQHDLSTLTITKLPYGLQHSTVIAKLDSLLEGDNVLDYTDSSKNEIKITVKFKRGYLKNVDRSEILKMLGLSVRNIENLNVLDFEGTSVWNATPIEVIQQFTDWRLGWYVARYERLRDKLQIDIQRYYDIRTAIKNNVGGTAKKVASRSELREYLETIKIVHTDYIADLPVYRFTQEEFEKNEQRIKDAEAQMAIYVKLLGSKEERVKVYISELQEVLTNFNKGVYNDQ